MGILESNLVSTRRIMSGFVEFIVAFSWDTLLVLLMLFRFIRTAFSLGLLVIFARSEVDVLAGFGANVGFISSEIFL